jgi:hypothetical protein
MTSSIPLPIIIWAFYLVLMTVLLSGAIYESWSARRSYRRMLREVSALPSLHRSEWDEVTVEINIGERF